MSGSAPWLCPPPEFSGSTHAELRQPFADLWRVRYAMRDGKIDHQTPCVQAQGPKSHAGCVEAIAADLAELDRLYLYTYTDNLNPSDPREVDFDCWCGPVKGSDVAGVRSGEKWYRLSDPVPVVQKFPNAILAGACQIGNAEAFAAALAAGADPHYAESSDSPMSLAVKHQRADMVALLIEAGWTGSKRGSQVWEALPAVEHGYVEILELLLGVGYLEAEHLSRLIGYSCDTQMAERLLAAGADPAMPLGSGYTPAFEVLRYDLAKDIPPRAANAASLIRWFDEHGADIATVGADNLTMLHLAVWRWNVDAIRALLELGAPLGMPYEYDGRTPEQAADNVDKGDEFRAILAACTARKERAPIPMRQPEPASPKPSEPRPDNLALVADDVVLKQGGDAKESGVTTGPAAEPAASAVPVPSADPMSEGHGEPSNGLRPRLLIGGALILFGIGLLAFGDAVLVGIAVAIVGLVVLLAGLSGSQAGQQSQAMSAQLIAGEIRADDYPSRAVRRELEGTVKVAVTIEPDGRASDVSVVQSSGHEILDAETCRIIQRRFRYRPACDEHGQAIREVQHQSVRWQL